jgi:Arc/MetJ-type ribon-helix-helix transcriptional regulator
MATINISLPQTMYEDAKKMLAQKRYATISELMRDALRKLLYRETTENGFTNEFEDFVLHAASESKEEDIILETDEDIKNYFTKLEIPKKDK